MKEKTKVIFRKFPTGDVIALFPEKPGSARSWAYCDSYQLIGQHGAASADLSSAQNTTAATPQEYAELKAELERIGYRLRVCKRYTAAMGAKRRAAFGTLAHRAAVAIRNL